MDDIDRKIAEMVQTDGRASSAEIANAVGVSVSTANERVRRLVSEGTITEWRGVLDPTLVGATLCVFVLVDMKYEGEKSACQALMAQPEVMELHHISGPHSYLLKVRIQDAKSLPRQKNSWVVIGTGNTPSA